MKFSLPDGLDVQVKWAHVCRVLNAHAYLFLHFTKHIAADFITHA